MPAYSMPGVVVDYVVCCNKAFVCIHVFLCMFDDYEIVIHGISQSVIPMTYQKICCIFVVFPYRERSCKGKYCFRRLSTCELDENYFPLSM